MSKEIKELKPQSVWSYFYDLTQIPRPTGHVKEVCEYLLNFAKEHKLEAHQDEVGNVIIRKPASAGNENKKVVTMQSHVDMVPQKNNETKHDFEKDPIDAHIDGEWVRARGTTLGADNGIGCAYALAVLSDDSLEHGPLEALFTIDEEVGMVGAFGLKPGFSKGDILLNLDSEEEGILYIGCAGGIDITATLDYENKTAVPEGDIAVKIELGGLKGGHSGMDIILGRANANKLMFRFLKKIVDEIGVCVAHVEGGSLRNAIPRECTAIVTLPEEQADLLWEAVSDFRDLFNTEYRSIEDEVKLEAERCDAPAHIVPAEIQDAVIHAMEGVQNGVSTMLHDFPDIVESSSNLAYVRLSEGSFEVKFLTRSSSNSRKMMVASSIESVFSLIGARVEFAGDYNGWQPNSESYVMDVLTHTYKDLFGKAPGVSVIHAGLECGILQGAMPNMDMISFGPDIRSPHSPDERVNIATVEKAYKFLIESLKRL